MMRWLARAATAVEELVVGLLGSPAGAAPREPLEKVAVLPVCIVNADRSNGDVMTQALAANLKHHGCTMIDDSVVRSAVAELRSRWTVPSSSRR